MRRLIVLVAVVVVAAGVSPAMAAFLPGVHPFGDYIGTGTRSVNFGSVGSWEDRNIKSTSFAAYPANSLLYYQATFATAQDLTAVVVDTSDRQASGAVYVATTPGGPLTNLYGTFNELSNSFALVSSPAYTSVYGIRVEVTGTTSDHLQAGGAEFWSEEFGPNVALGIPGISSPNAQSFDAVALTNGRYQPRAWRANSDTSANPEQWVGVEFAAAAVQGIRVTVAGADADQYGWKDFQVQVKSGGVWTAVGMASMAGNENIFWGAFDNPMSNVIEGVRLYGSNALGNNPGASEGGLIVNEIQVFAPIPEPAALGMLGLAGLMMLRRRGARSSGF